MNVYEDMIKVKTKPYMDSLIEMREEAEERLDSVNSAIHDIENELEYPRDLSSYQQYQLEQTLIMNKKRKEDLEYAIELLNDLISAIRSVLPSVW